MGITWRDFFRGAGAAATYVSAGLREDRLLQEEEDRDKRKFLYQQRVMDGLERARMKKEREWRRSDAEWQLNLTQKYEREKRERDLSIDRIGLSATKELENISTLPINDPRRMGTMAKLTVITDLMGRIKGGQHDLQSPDDKVAWDMIDVFDKIPLQEAMFKGRKLDEQMALQTQLIESNISLNRAMAGKHNAEVEKWRLNPMNITPAQASLKIAEIYEAMKGITGNKAYQDVREMLAAGTDPSEIDPALLSPFKFAENQLEEFKYQLGFYELARGNLPEPDDIEPPDDPVTKEKKERYGSIPGFSQVARAVEKQALAGEGIVQRPLGKGLEAVATGAPKAFKKFKESFKSQRESIRKLKRKHNITREVFSYEEFQKMRRDGELESGMIMYVNGDLWEVNEDATNVDKVE